jgi:serine/threonine protein phosphatase PrpC
MCLCLPVAERIGVNAEPECLVKEITPETECIVLASDGVFEFLSSQRVIDIVRFSTAVSLMGLWSAAVKPGAQQLFDIVR